EDLAVCLGLEKGAQIELVIPSVPSSLVVNIDQAVACARENNPHFIEYQVALEEARRDAERARVQKSLNLSLDVSLGLNQIPNRFAAAYANPLMQDMVVVTLSVPLFDGGKRKHSWEAAVSRLDATERAAEENARDTELEVRFSVEEFNERQALLAKAEHALEIAEDVYTQTLQRFIKGQADVYNLSMSQTYWQSARQNRIASLQNYWLSYYHLRRLTLYDYQRCQSICYVK
ncbi:MAG: TolC family protein, partial [Bacteroidales bacterium]|nr:TolC family protein [Bacteroidales bacterium]